MKRIFISSDIEGTCGIAHWDETELSKPDHARFARQMTREVSAACEGAFAAGADDILIKDAHDSARNLLPEELPEGISIFRGWGSDIHSMMSGIDESFAGCFFTGYHSSSNTDQNPLSHTFNTRNTSIRVNGIQTSEMLMNAYSAALYDVPVLLVTGDLGVCEQAKALLPGVYTVRVSARIGTVLVLYDQAVCTTRQILRWVDIVVDTGLEIARETAREELKSEAEIASIVRQRLVLRLPQCTESK